MTSLLLIPMMLFAALAVDVGGWYARGHEAQAAADAAALAGVPFLPNESEALKHALDAAARNGYADRPGCDGAPVDCKPTDFPQVVVQRIGGRSLQVTIFTEGDVFFGRMVMDSITIERYAVAEFAEPVPLGSPTSAIGMGTEPVAGVVSNYFLRALNECEPRGNGDFIGSAGPCRGSSNPNYRPEGHTFIVDIPTAGSYKIQARTTCAEFGGRHANGSVRFRLFDTDNTPFDDNDNVLVPPLNEVTVDRPATSICPANGSGWSPTRDPAPWIKLGTVNRPGRYVVQAKNPGFLAGLRTLYSLRVVPQGGGANFACSRIGPSGSSGCPTIVPKDYVTVFTNNLMFPSKKLDGARLYLAEINDQHAGETMIVELFDPADGIQDLRLVDPHGNHVNLSWYSIDCSTYNYNCARGDLGSINAPISQTCGGVSCLKQERGISLQDRTILVNVDLPDNYTCSRPAGEPENCWWQVEYSGERGNETTTWGVSVTGDPVSLVE